MLKLFLYFQKEQKHEMNRERVKGNNRDTFIDSYDYEMLINDENEVSLGQVRLAESTKLSRK